MDNKNGWLTNNRHTKQLKKHILAVSTCKIHRLKTNSTSVTALSMGRCPHPGTSVFMKKGQTLCVCIVCVCMCVDIASYTFGQILGHCLHVIPEETWLSSKPVSGNKRENLGLERDQSRGTSTSCHMTSDGFLFHPWAFSLPPLKAGGETSPLSSCKLLSSFQIMTGTDCAFFKRMVQLIPLYQPQCHLWGMMCWATKGESEWSLRIW